MDLRVQELADAQAYAAAAWAHAHIGNSNEAKAKLARAELAYRLAETKRSGDWPEAVVNGLAAIRTELDRLKTRI